MKILFFTLLLMSQFVYADGILLRADCISERDPTHGFFHVEVDTSYPNEVTNVRYRYLSWETQEVSSVSVRESSSQHIYEGGGSRLTISISKGQAMHPATFISGKVPLTRMKCHINPDLLK